MKYMIIALFIFMALFSVAEAAENNFTHKTKKDRFCVIEKVPMAQSPIGAIVETTGVFVGKIASNMEAAWTGEKKIAVENETGECRIFPFSTTTKVVDKTFNTVTMNKLKVGDKVKVDYMEEGGVDTAVGITVEK